MTNVIVYLVAKITQSAEVSGFSWLINSKWQKKECFVECSLKKDNCLFLLLAYSYILITCGRIADPPLQFEKEKKNKLFFCSLLALS